MLYNATPNIEYFYFDLKKKKINRKFCSSTCIHVDERLYIRYVCSYVCMNVCTYVCSDVFMVSTNYVRYAHMYVLCKHASAYTYVYVCICFDTG